MLKKRTVHALRQKSSSILPTTPFQPKQKTRALHFQNVYT